MSKPAPRRPSADCSLSIDLPRQVIRLLAPTVEEATLQAKELILVELFRRGEISAGRGAELLGIDKWGFIQLLGQYGVPYLDQTPEELDQEVQTLRTYLRRRQGPSISPSQTPAP